MPSPFVRRQRAPQLKTTSPKAALFIRHNLSLAARPGPQLSCYNLSLAICLGRSGSPAIACPYCDFRSNPVIAANGIPV